MFQPHRVVVPLFAALAPLVLGFSPNELPGIANDISKIAGVRLDPSLHGAARLHAYDIAKDRNRGRWERVKRALRREGIPDAQFWPVAVFGRDPGVLVERLRAATKSQARTRRATHVGIGVATRGEVTAFVALFVRRLVRMSPLPTAPTRTGRVLRGRVIRGARLEGLLMGPCADTRCVGGVRTLAIRANVGGWSLPIPPMVGEGTWTLELMVDTDRGPEPAVLWQFHEGAMPPTIAPRGPPGQWVQSFRADHDLAPLRVSRALMQAAERHAQQVCVQRFAAHIISGADPQHRARDAGYQGHVTENVAVAPTAAEAHRDLLLSPSHRRNIIDPTAADYGMSIASAVAAPGARPIRCWVELFGYPRGSD